MTDTTGQSSNKGLDGQIINDFTRNNKMIEPKLYMNNHWMVLTIGGGVCSLEIQDDHTRRSTFQHGI
jgi:hypothetical protein